MKECVREWAAGNRIRDMKRKAEKSQRPTVWRRGKMLEVVIGTVITSVAGEREGVKGHDAGSCGVG